MNKSATSPLQTWGLAIFFSLAGAIITYCSSSLYGPGLSPDSAGYLNLAKDISNNGFQFISEIKSITQPPLYPISLSLISSIAGTSHLQSALLINVICAFLLILMVYFSAYTISKSIAATSTISILTCTSIPLNNTWSMAWTEPLFITLVFASLAIIIKAQSSQKQYLIIIAGLFTAAAILTRYVGVILIPLLFLFITFTNTYNFFNTLRKVSLFTLPPILILIAYLVRNYVISETLFGERHPGQLSLAENFNLAVQTIFTWFIPIKVASLITQNNILLILSVTVIGSLSLIKREIIINLFSKTENTFRLHLCFAASFTAFIIWSSTSTSYDHIDNRLLSPIFPSLIVTFAFFLSPKHWKNLSRWKILFTVFSLVLIITPFRATLYEIRHNISSGAGGYNTKAWHDSQLMSHLKNQSNTTGLVIYTNSPEATYLLVGIRALESPAARQYNSDSATGINKHNLFEKYSNIDGALLAWFDMTHRDYLYSPKQLSNMTRLHIIQEFEDGTLYKIEKLSH